MKKIHWPLGEPNNCTLKLGEVHLWCAHLASLSRYSTVFMSVLSRSEQSTTAKYMRDSDRLLSTCAKGMLRTILASYLRSDPRILTFVSGINGKPALANNHGPTFNLSHSGDTVLLAVANRSINVGVDLELRRSIKEWQTLAVKYFHPREVLELLTMPPDDGELAFFDCWTSKEAVVKALGMGLSLPLNSFRVSVRCPPEEQLLDCSLLSQKGKSLLLSPLELSSNYSATLAINGSKSHSIHCWQFDPTETCWHFLRDD